MPQNHSHTQLSDQELIAAFRQSGNNQYLGWLLQRYTLLLFGVCMKYLKNEEDAKDAVQQVFAKVITELPKYEVAYFSSWLYTVARNHCLIMLRHKKTVSADNLALTDESAEDLFLSKADKQADEKMLQWVEQGLDLLQEPQKQCVSLFYLQRKSYQQIAEQTGISLMQVKSAIQNGKRNIRIWVEKKMKQPHAS